MPTYNTGATPVATQDNNETEEEQPVLIERIPYLPPSLRKDKILSYEAENCFIELHPAYMIWAVYFVSEKPKDGDDAIQFTERTFFHVTIDKTQITTIELVFNQECGRWFVNVLVKGTTIDYNTFFIKQKDALAFRDKIFNWKFKS